MEQQLCNDCGNCGLRLQREGQKHAVHELPADGAQCRATIDFTQTKVEWLEKLSGGGWRIHGQYVKGPNDSQKFTLDASEVVPSFSGIA